MQKFRSTYDVRAIYQTSYEECKAFLIGTIHMQERFFNLDAAAAHRCMGGGDIATAAEIPGPSTRGRNEADWLINGPGEENPPRQRR